MFMLMAHYRSPLNYSTEILEQAKAALERLDTTKSNLEFFIENGASGGLSPSEEGVADGLSAFRSRFIESMDDDFNTADAVSIIFEMARYINSAVNPSKEPSGALAGICYDLFLELSDVLGIPFKDKDDLLGSVIEGLIEKRQEARGNKDYAEADRIRDELALMGIILEDTPQGVKWKRA
jgi:cysteinyl-tRNA synthetase